MSTQNATGTKPAEYVPSASSESAAPSADASTSASLPFLTRGTIAPRKKRAVKEITLPSGAGRAHIGALSPNQVDEINERHASIDEDGKPKFTNAGRRMEWAALALCNADGTPLEGEWLAFAEELGNYMSGPDLDFVYKEAMDLSGYTATKAKAKNA